MVAVPQNNLNRASLEAATGNHVNKKAPRAIIMQGAFGQTHHVAEQAVVEDDLDEGAGTQHPVDALAEDAGVEIDTAALCVNLAIDPVDHRLEVVGRIADAPDNLGIAPATAR